MYGTVGVTRRKDVPRITALTAALTSGALASRFDDHDCEAFTSFMAARRCRYPLFFAAKRAWVTLPDALPPSVSAALNHHVQLRANKVFRTLNRNGHLSRRCQEQAGT
jgi:hypothetical protein